MDNFIIKANVLLIIFFFVTAIYKIIGFEFATLFSLSVLMARTIKVRMKPAVPSVIKDIVEKMSVEEDSDNKKLEELERKIDDKINKDV